MEVYSYSVLIALLYFNIISCARDGNKCNGTILYDHYNLSKMDDEEKKLDIFCGEEINLPCQLDEISLKNGCLPSELTYNFGLGVKSPEGSIIRLVNNTALEFKMVTKEQRDFTISCLYNNTGLNNLVLSVNVGCEPQPIQIKCLVIVNLNQASLKCEFRMSGNPVKENYHILYSNHSTIPEIYEPVEFDQNNQDSIRKWAIQLSKYEDLDLFGKFTFRVNATNKFGERSTEFTFNTKQIIVIPEPQHKIVNVASKSIVIEIIVIKLDFTYDVTVCHKFCSNRSNYFQVNITDSTTIANETHFNITLNISLPHAYYTYYILKVNFQLKDALYPDEQLKRAKVKTISFKTTASQPEYPPTTFTNGFEIGAGHVVILYWKEISDAYKNGPKFNYRVSEIYENGKLLQTVNWTILSNSTGRLSNLDSNKNYSLRMISENSMGPSANHMIPPPDHMRKTINHNNYLLSWNPSTKLNIVNYTIYWCTPLEESERTCGTLLGYKTLSKNETTFTSNTTTTSGMISFAIAVNTKNSSSGLVWFECPKGNTLTISRVTHSEITINWMMPCHKNRKTHLSIVYCKNDPINNTTCETNKKYNNSTTIDQELIVLTKLDRCTPYRIEIENLHENAIVRSQRMRDGAAPIPQIQPGNITNTTIEIFWSLPYELCPGQSYYNIISSKLAKPFRFNNTGAQRYTIKKLTSFSLYDIKLAVCYEEDKQCSEYSKTIYIKTQFGIPSGIDNFNSNINDDGFVYMSWKPSARNADYQYYEVKRISTKDGTFTELISIVSDVKCTFIKKPCGGVTNYTHFVRIINSDQWFNTSYDQQMNVCLEEIAFNITILCNNVKCLVGDWVQYKDSICFDISWLIKFSVIVVMTLAVAASLFASMLIGIKKYRTIKNVGHVSVPDGLESIFQSRSKTNLKLVFEPPIIEDDESTEVYCTYEYLFSSANQLDKISMTDLMATLENQNDYLEYNCDLVPLPNPGNYVKLNSLQNQQQTKPTISGYTSISALQTDQILLPDQSTKREIQLLNKIPAQTNCYLPVSAMSTIPVSSMAAPVPTTMPGYVPIQMLQTMKPRMAVLSNGYTPVSALQHNPMKLPALSTNGYISIAALQGETS